MLSSFLLKSWFIFLQIAPKDNESGKITIGWKLIAYFACGSHEANFDNNRVDTRIVHSICMDIIMQFVQA